MISSLLIKVLQLSAQWVDTYRNNKKQTDSIHVHLPYNQLISVHVQEGGKYNFTKKSRIILLTQHRLSEKMYLLQQETKAVMSRQAGSMCLFRQVFNLLSALSSYLTTTWKIMCMSSLGYGFMSVCRTAAQVLYY